MNARRSAVGLLLASLLATSVSAQDAPRRTAAAAPAEGGLLLGFETSGTVFVVFDGDSVRVAWRSPYLVTPRPDGYWFAIGATRCAVDLDSAHGGGGLGYPLAFVDRYSALTLARAGDSVNVALGGSMRCEEAESEVTRARAAAYRAALDSVKGDSTKVEQPAPATADEPLDCIVEGDRVSWLSPTAVSMLHRYSQTEFCSPGGYTTNGSNSVTRLATGAPVRLRPMLPARLRRAAERARREPNDCFSEDGPGRLDDSWGVFRKEGRWIADVWLDGSNACRGGREYELDLPLPSAFTGDRPLPMRWRTLRKQFPNASDALLSPSGTILAMLRGDSVVAHPAAGARIGAALGHAAIPGNEPLVMAVWATPAEAAKWRREMPRLIPPAVRVVQPRGSQ